MGFPGQGLDRTEGAFWRALDRGFYVVQQLCVVSFVRELSSMSGSVA